MFDGMITALHGESSVPRSEDTYIHEQATHAPIFRENYQTQQWLG